MRKRRRNYEADDLRGALKGGVVEDDDEPSVPMNPNYTGGADDADDQDGGGDHMVHIGKAISAILARQDLDSGEKRRKISKILSIVLDDADGDDEDMEGRRYRGRGRGRSLTESLKRIGCPNTPAGRTAFILGTALGGLGSIKSSRVPKSRSRDAFEARGIPADPKARIRWLMS